MKGLANLFVVIGCLLLLAAVIMRGMGFYNPAVMRVIKPSSLLILVNTSFILAVLLKR